MSLQRARELLDRAASLTAADFGARPLQGFPGEIEREAAWIRQCETERERLVLEARIMVLEAERAPMAKCKSCGGMKTLGGSPCRPCNGTGLAGQAVVDR